MSPLRITFFVVGEGQGGFMFLFGSFCLFVVGVFGCFVLFEKQSILDVPHVSDLDFYSD